MSNPTVYVLLPAYNEVRSLRLLVPDIDQTLRGIHRSFQIVVVNDGSTDETASWFKESAGRFPLTCLFHSKNSGYGAALNTGYSWIVDHAAADDVVISLDADTTHSPRYFPALLEAIEGGAQVVTASYSMPGGQALGVPFKRRLMSRLANALFCVLAHVRGARTYTNGFRAYRVGILQRVGERHGTPLIHETGFPGGAELFVKAGRLAGSAAEVPFTLEYHRRGTDSKINMPRTIAGYLSLLVRLLLRS